MGLFSAGRSKKETKPIALATPTPGEIIELTTVPDPVFSAGTVGAGCGIRPNGESVVAPISATVGMIAKTGHAVGLITDEGFEVLIHIGIDTVNMEGEGFVTFVEQGEHVQAGDPLIAFTRSAIRAAGYDDTVVMVIPTPGMKVELPVLGIVGSGDTALMVNKQE